MTKLLLSILVALCLAVPSASADLGIFKSPMDLTPGTTGIPLNDLAQKSKSLFSKDRLSFEHTLGMSFGSGQSGGLNQYYLNTITYKVSKPLVITAQLGFQNTLSGKSAYGSPVGNRMQLVVPYVGVLYQPRPNFRIEFQFSNMPSYGRRSYFY